MTGANQEGAASCSLCSLVDKLIMMIFFLICELDSTKLHIMMLLFSYAFVGGDQSYDAFKYAFNIIQKLEDEDELEAELSSHDLSATIEWIQIAAAMLITDDNEQVLVRLRHNVTSNSPHAHRQLGATRWDSHQIAGFSSLFLLFLTMAHHAASGFLVPSSLSSLSSNNIALTDDKPTMSPIALFVIEIANNCMGKAAANTTNMLLMKEKDELSN